MQGSRRGVILLNIGGPDTLNDVRPFLYNLFSDREIIKLGPPFLQKYIAWYIARKRAPKSESIYKKIGGSSPLKKITIQQAKALEEILESEGDYQVEIAMRYWPPYARDAVTKLIDNGVQRITAVSLYPHFSRATSGSSISDLKQYLSESGTNIPINFIPSWPEEELYVAALTKNIVEAVEFFSPEPVEVVYSAHSLPTSFIKAGDPYVDHINSTIAAIEKQTGLTGNVCYQSRSGPVEWLSPSTPAMLKTLAEKGCKNIVMVPISFVSDHVETLYEIDMLYKEQAKSLGMRLISSKSLNTDPLFIEALRNLVLKN
jgi:ferrochelatase